MMDLRTFFGDWEIGQSIYVRQTNSNNDFSAEVSHYTAHKVALIAGEEGEPFSLSLEVAGNGQFSLQINPGKGKAPSFLSGNNLPGHAGAGPLSPDTLFVSGHMEMSNNKNQHVPVSGKVEYNRVNSSIFSGACTISIETDNHGAFEYQLQCLITS